MQALSRASLAEHAARHLREGFRSGLWRGCLPGVRQLAAQLGVSRDTAREALQLVEAEGLVIHAGPGRARQVAPPADSVAARTLRVGILLPIPLHEDNAHTHHLISGVQQAVESLGHVCFIAPRVLAQLGQRPARVLQHLQECGADAWIIYSAPRLVLEAAAGWPLRVFALGGVSEGLALPGTRTDLTAPMEAAVDFLTERGHRKVVLICPPWWRSPGPNHAATAFLRRLEANAGPRRIDPAYHLPEWEHTPEGLHELLRALFFATAPTALLIMEPECVGPALVFLAGRGLEVPGKVSVVNLLPDPMQAFYRVPLAHFEWPLQRHVQNVVRWIRSVARGRPDNRYGTLSPLFVPAGSIGAAPGHERKTSRKAQA